MSRASPRVAPVMDEDFDLCISETNLPFPYSDHCSTGPPSLYEFEDNGEEDEDEEDNIEDEDEEGEDSDYTENEHLQEGDIIVRKERYVEDGSDDNEAPTLLRSRLSASNDGSYSQTARHRTKALKDDLPIQLQSRLEHIHGREALDRNTSSMSLNNIRAIQPRVFRRSYSFESNGGWHESEDDHAHLLLEEEDEELRQRQHGHYHHHQQQQQQQQDKGLIPTVTSAVSSIAYAVGKHWSKKIYESLLRSRDPKAYYTHLLKAATNYEQWAEAAAVLDQLHGKDKWKNDPRSPHYDYEMLQERLKQLASARESGDLGLMIFLLRTSLSRNLGNVGRPQLYAETIIGTKRLIEDYNSEVIRQLNIICDTESDDFSTAAKLEFFTHTRQAFGRTALLLSGGATMGLIHIGVVKTLYQNKLLPRIISGSSCGSIIAAILCTRTDEEIPSMLQFEKFNFTVFHTLEEQGDVLARLIHFLKNGALFDAQVLKAALKDNIGDVTFQEAYNRTRRILNVTVSTSATFEMPRLLNYLTAPNVLVWSAVATSCAAPFIYNSAPLMAKDKNGEEVQWNPSRYHWIDGSVENDLPMNKLSELFNVNHFIVCQVNPYIVPFLQNSLARSPTNRVLGWMLYQARSELQHRMNQLSLLGIMPVLIHKAQAIMSQRYYGDITIVPNLGVDDYLNIVSNPTVQFMVDAMLKGERATWPKISIIKNHCSIEHCLDDILYRLRLRRLEAYRAYPQQGVSSSSSSTTTATATGSTRSANPTLTKMATSSYIHTQQQLHQQHISTLNRPASSIPANALTAGSNASTIRGSASACFATFGRSNSSPASSSSSGIVGMSRSATPMRQSYVQSTLNAAVTGTGKELGAGNSLQQQQHQIPQASVTRDLATGQKASLIEPCDEIDQDTLRLIGSSPADITTLPPVTAADAINAEADGFTRQRPASGPRRGSSGSVHSISRNSAPPLPTLKRAHTSSGHTTTLSSLSTIANNNYAMSTAATESDDKEGADGTLSSSIQHRLQEDVDHSAVFNILSSDTSNTSDSRRSSASSSANSSTYSVTRAETERQAEYAPTESYFTKEAAMDTTTIHADANEPLQSPGGEAATPTMTNSSAVNSAARRSSDGVGDGDGPGRGRSQSRSSLSTSHHVDRTNNTSEKESIVTTAATTTTNSVNGSNSSRSSSRNKRNKDFAMTSLET